MTTKLFVYGTLVGKYENAEKATLKGVRKEGLCITPEKENEVEGEVIEVGDQELRRLDAYEGTPRNYKRVEVDDGIQAYVGNPEHRPVQHDYSNLEQEFKDVKVTTN